MLHIQYNLENVFPMDIHIAYSFCDNVRLCFQIANCVKVDCYEFGVKTILRYSLASVNDVLILYLQIVLQQFVKIIAESKRRTSENFVILTTSYDRILKGTPPVFQNISLYDIFVWMHYYATRDNLLFSQQLLTRYANAFFTYLR